jgi:hypothetical protein
VAVGVFVFLCVNRHTRVWTRRIFGALCLLAALNVFWDIPEAHVGQAVLDLAYGFIAYLCLRPEIQRWRQAAAIRRSV